MMRRLLFTAASILLLIPTLLLAQPDVTVTFYGAIQSANATALVVNGQIVDIRDAQMSTPLVVGMIVRVEATFSNDGGLVAQAVDAVAPGAIPGIVAISGDVTKVTEDTITIGGQTIDISAVPIPRNPIVGLPVTVYAVAHGANTWFAYALLGGANAPAAASETQPVPAATPELVATPEVGEPAATPDVVSTPEVSEPAATPEVSEPVSTPEVAAPAATPELSAGETFRVEGTLEAIGSRAIIVDGQRYDIGSARRDGTLVVGARVRLELRVVGNQAVLEEIKVTDDPPGDDSGGKSGGGGSDD